MKVIGILIILLGLGGIGFAGLFLIVGCPNEFIKLLLLSLLVTGGGTGLVISGIRRDDARDRQRWEAMYRSEPTPVERMYAHHRHPNQPTFDDRRPEDDIRLDLDP